MNGELILKGYKFSSSLILNLQDKTVLTGPDTFLAYEVFNFLENYFNRRTFSEYYLDKGTVLILNGNKLSGSEFAVFRISPTVNITDELKVSKKSVMGQAIHAAFDDSDGRLLNLVAALQTNVLTHLNSVTEKYGVSFVCEEPDIFTVAKILKPMVRESGGQDILEQEHNQFYCKSMMVDFVSRLKTNKKKMLLVECPEYGLKEDEITEFLRVLSAAPVDNIIISTHQGQICQVIPQVYNYNLLKRGRIYGFDDYDRLETQLQNIVFGSSREEIEHKVLEYIFQTPSGPKDEFAQTVDEFLS